MEVLTKDQIDGLLAEINDPKKSFESVKTIIYDFCRPDFYSGYSRELSILHNHTAGLWIKHFYQHLQKDTHIYCKSIDNVTQEEFVRSLPYSTVYSIVNGFLDSVPLPQPFYIAIDPCFSINQTILDDLSKSLINEYAEIWKKRHNLILKFQLDSIETTPRFIDVTNAAKMGALVEMEAKIDDIEGKIKIFLPKFFLKPILAHIPRMIGSKESNRNLNNKEDIMDNRISSNIQTGLENVKVQVVTELGRSVKTLKEINEVKEGSIMLMDAYSGEPVDIFVNNVLFGRGEVIVVDECFGVRFTEVIGQDSVQNEQESEKENKGV